MKILLMDNIVFYLVMFFLAISALCMVLSFIMLLRSFILRGKKYPDEEKSSNQRRLAIFIALIGSVCLLPAFVFLFIGD